MFLTALGSLYWFYQSKISNKLLDLPVADDDAGRLNKLKASTDRKRQRMNRSVVIWSILLIWGLRLIRKNQAVATSEMRNKGHSKYFTRNVN